MARIEPADYSHVSDEWMREFRGIFVSEGCILLDIHRRRARHQLKGGEKVYESVTVRPSMRIDLHPREKPTLIEFQRVLGGSIKWHPNPDSNYGRHRWMLENWSRVGPLCRRLVTDVAIPHAKIEELELVADLFDWRIRQKHTLTREESEYLFAERDRLLSLRRIW